MKRIIFCIFCLTIAFTSPVGGEGEMRRGLFVTVLQYPPVLSSRSEIRKLVSFAKRADIDVLYVQIYRANQAWFSSNFVDDGPYETCVKKISEDPFQLLIKEAHAAGIKVNAWLNLLSLGANKDAPLLKKYGTDILTKNLKQKRRLEDYKIDNQYFLEPGDPRVREELYGMVEEMLIAYPELDGILFDYIRYPDQHPAYGFTKMNVERFKKATGRTVIAEKSQEWQEWKREQVTELLEGLVHKVRSIRPGMEIGTTGCAPYVRAYYEAFQDWPSWLEEDLVDSVTVMTYSPDMVEFEKFVRDARNRVDDTSKINIAIGAYELTDSPETFTREYELCKKTGVSGFVVFHYGSLLQNPALAGVLTKSDKP